MCLFSLYRNILYFLFFYMSVVKIKLLLLRRARDNNNTCPHFHVSEILNFKFLVKSWYQIVKKNTRVIEVLHSLVLKLCVNIIFKYTIEKIDFFDEYLYVSFLLGWMSGWVMNSNRLRKSLWHWIVERNLFVPLYRSHFGGSKVKGCLFLHLQQYVSHLL